MVFIECMRVLSGLFGLVDIPLCWSIRTFILCWVLPRGVLDCSIKQSKTTKRYYHNTPGQRQRCGSDEQEQLLSKMQTILNDNNRFKKKTDTSLHKQSLKQEDKVNRTIKKLYERKIISKDQYISLYASGSGPAILYGLPKVQKADVPLWPIIAAYNTPSFNIAIYLVALLQDLTLNKFTMRNSYSFQEDITKFQLPDNCFFFSTFDIASLFTNIPVNETIDIICNSLFPNTDSSFHSFNKSEFQELLYVSAKESIFLFDGTPYIQVDGATMGSPLGSTLANAFLSHHEKIWLDSCPTEYKPIYYRRYIDDTFVIFSKPEHAQKFLDYLNNQHINNKFTKENEQNRSIPFLGMNISLSNE